MANTLRIKAIYDHRYEIENLQADAYGILRDATMGKQYQEESLEDLIHLRGIYNGHIHKEKGTRIWAHDMPTGNHNPSTYSLEKKDTAKANLYVIEKLVDNILNQYFQQHHAALGKALFISPFARRDIKKAVTDIAVMKDIDPSKTVKQIREVIESAFDHSQVLKGGRIYVSVKNKESMDRFKSHIALHLAPPLQVEKKEAPEETLDYGSFPINIEQSAGREAPSVSSQELEVPAAYNGLPINTAPIASPTPKKSANKEERRYLGIQIQPVRRPDEQPLAYSHSKQQALTKAHHAHVQEQQKQKDAAPETVQQPLKPILKSSQNKPQNSRKGLNVYFEGDQAPATAVITTKQHVEVRPAIVISTQKIKSAIKPAQPVKASTNSSEKHKNHFQNVLNTWKEIEARSLVPSR